MTEPTDEEIEALCPVGCKCGSCRVARRDGYRAGVASQAARIAELEGERDAQRGIAQQHERDWYDAKSEFGDAMERLQTERDTLTRELAEAQEGLRKANDTIAAFRIAMTGPTGDAHRSAKTSAGDGARDDGPPRVGDVVRVDNIPAWDKSNLHKRGEEYVVAEARGNVQALIDAGRIVYPGMFLLVTENNRTQGTWCYVTVIRRAGQPEAKAPGVFAALKNAGFEVVAEKPGLPGGPGPNTDRLAELERTGELLGGNGIATRVSCTKATPCKNGVHAGPCWRVGSGE